MEGNEGSGEMVKTREKERGGERGKEKRKLGGANGNCARRKIDEKCKIFTLKCR